ncbi:MAG: YeeE/YedE family protein [Deltaproteobacteria bacterium]|nr:YeeE/YedE family protein [Deltaproteobacteria bacterium]
MTEVIVWSGFIGGLAVGLYGLIQLFVTGKALGVSTGYGNVCGLSCATPYFHSGEYKTNHSWRIWFIVGLPLGGLIAVLTSPGPLVLSFSLGPMYDSIFPAALWAKGLLLTAGGVLMGLGARMSGGCTSGHAIAGLSLLNLPSLLASAGFFVGGLLIANLLFRVIG